MSIVKTSALALLAVSVSGCTPVLKELRHSGGYPGYVMDKRFFDASHSKQLQLLRAAMVVSMASAVAPEFISDRKDIETFISYLEATTDEINYLAGHIYPIEGKVLCTDLKTTNCDAHSLMFESDLPLLEDRIVRLVTAALPRDRAADFLAAAKGGDVLSAAWKALRLAASVAGGAHRAAAVHRSGLELRGLLVQYGGESSCATQVPDPLSTVNEAALCMNQSLEYLRAPNDTPLPRKVPITAFQAVFGEVRKSCALLPITSDLTTEEETSANDKAARLKACRALAFKPKLRFGGLRGFEDDNEEGSEVTQAGTSATAAVTVQP
jgi:hypothetical protein